MWTLNAWRKIVGRIEIIKSREKILNPIGKKTPIAGSKIQAEVEILIAGKENTR